MTRRRSLTVVPVAAVLAAGLAAAAWSCRSAPPAPAPDVPPVEVSGDLAITNVTVIDTAAGVARPGLTVVVRADRVAGVLPAGGCRVAAGTRVIDGTGKFLIPGLWDMHAHVIDPAMPGIFLRHGVTGVRHMFSVNPWYQYARPTDPDAPPHPRVVAANQVLDGPGTPFNWPVDKNVRTVRNADEARKRVGELKAGGNEFVKVYAMLPRDAYLAAAAAARGQGLRLAGHVPHAVPVGEASDAGQWTVEHLNGIALECSREEDKLRARMKAWLPDGRGGFDPLLAASAWKDQVTAFQSRDPEKEAALLSKFVANGTWHVPTLTLDFAFSRLADPAALPPGAEEALPDFLRRVWRREWDGVPGFVQRLYPPSRAVGTVRVPTLSVTQTPEDTRLRAELLRHDTELVGRMHRAGVRLLAGTDTPAPLILPGASLHDELGLFVSAGLTPAEALRAATLDPARCLGREHELGTVEAGKLADLVLLSADPLTDIANTRRIERVLVGGRAVAP